jgi:hypothetical protein
MGEGLFAPDESVTRAQLLALMVRTLNLDLVDTASEQFHDVPADAWYALEVSTAHEAGLVAGTAPGELSPLRRITREEIAVFMARMSEFVGINTALTPAEVNAVLEPFEDRGDLSEWAVEAVAHTVNQGIISGRSDSLLAPQGYANRAETVVMFKRFMDVWLR